MFVLASMPAVDDTGSLSLMFSLELMSWTWDSPACFKIITRRLRQIFDDYSMHSRRDVDAEIRCGSAIVNKNKKCCNKCVWYPEPHLSCYLDSTLVTPSACHSRCHLPLESMAILSKSAPDGKLRRHAWDPELAGERRTYLKMMMINLALVTASWVAVHFWCLRELI